MTSFEGAIIILRANKALLHKKYPALSKKQENAPANNQKYTNQKGCNFLIRLTPSVREKINY